MKVTMDDSTVSSYMVSLSFNQFMVMWDTNRNVAGANEIAVICEQTFFYVKTSLAELLVECVIEKRDGPSKNKVKTEKCPQKALRFLQKKYKKTEKRPVSTTTYSH